MKDSLFILMQYLAPQHLLSRLAGKLANCPWSVIKGPFIRWFIQRYGVDMTQALEPDPSAYSCFNAFFTRALRADARPLHGDDSTILCPADGVVSQLGPVRDGLLLQAKGRRFNLQALLGGDPTLAAEFDEGCFATIYLSPSNYHRVHMPLPGVLREMTYVPGKLFSVNQLTAERVDDLFARNERLVCIFDTDCGPMALILVGAMIVGSIDTVWSGQAAPAPHGLRRTDYRQQRPAVQIARGGEMGRFKLGSTVIAVFAENRVELNSALAAGNFIDMGAMLGTAIAAEDRHL
ncbi:MAG: phosphatidylserine decarboxylase [Gammaproteobacteria bacterium]|nr:phosphatidylserine decarboxylase [Gammaproteobacteria bacterium]|tara:strand:- start:74 stop:949 length:876 start_codon:yes stop_codon:yes gene_type:complete